MKRTFEKLIVRLAGEDIKAYSLCSTATKKLILFIGLLVAGVFTLTVLSITEAFTTFFHSNVVGISIGLFFGWLVSNMYLLLLYTMTYNVLTSEEKPIRQKASLFVRYCTVLFLGFVVSMPVGHFLLEGSVLDKTIQDKKSKIDYLSTEINKQYQYQINISSPEKQALLFERKEKELADIKSTIMDNPFYINTVRILLDEGVIYLVSILCMLIFISPMIFKVKIPHESTYYRNKRNAQLALINTEYRSFKKKYKQTLKAFSSENLEFIESYTDAPFNLQPIKNAVPKGSQEDLLNYIYGDSSR